MSELGPAMQKLKPRQQAFVRALLENGGKQSAAARTAGYVGTSVARTASDMVHNPRILTAIKEESKKRDAGMLPFAHRALSAIAKNSAHPDQFKAAKHLQAIAGVSPTLKTEVIVQHKTTTELKAELQAAMDLLQSVTQLEDAP